MAEYTIKYPVVIADPGDGIEDGFEKTASEFAEVYSIFNNRLNGSTGHPHDGSEHGGPKISGANIVDDTITAAKLKDDVVSTKLGYTPADEAGDEANQFSVANASGIHHALALGQLSCLFNASGYVKIPMVDVTTSNVWNLLVQWTTKTGSGTWTFPIPFYDANSIYAMTGAIKGVSGDTDNYTATFGTPTATTVSVTLSKDSGGYSGSATVIAIGRGEN